MPRPNEAEFTEARTAREQQGQRAADVLTPRDWFAGKALMGIIAARGYYSVDGIDVSLPTPDDAAQQAYRYADAMLVARGH